MIKVKVLVPLPANALKLLGSEDLCHTHKKPLCVIGHDVICLISLMFTGHDFKFTIFSHSFSLFLFDILVLGKSLVDG